MNKSSGEFWNIYYSLRTLEVIKQRGAGVLELLIQAIHFATCYAALTDQNMETW
jgi:hypothetical protein